MKEIQEAIEKAKTEFQNERTRILSEMLDNPDEYEIYPTTKCFNALDELWDRLSIHLLSLVAEKQIVDDGIKEATQNALYATGKFSELQCEELSEGIFQYIKDYYKVFPSSQKH